MDTTSDCNMTCSLACLLPVLFSVKLLLSMALLWQLSYKQSWRVFQHRSYMRPSLLEQDMQSLPLVLSWALQTSSAGVFTSVNFLLIHLTNLGYIFL